MSSLSFVEQISLITSGECIESNVISIEAKKFLEEETAAEAMNNAPVANEPDDNEEDLVSRTTAGIHDLNVLLA